MLSRRSYDAWEFLLSGSCSRVFEGPLIKCFFCPCKGQNTFRIKGESNLTCCCCCCCCSCCYCCQMTTIDINMARNILRRIKRKILFFLIRRKFVSRKSYKFGTRINIDSESGKKQIWIVVTLFRRTWHQTEFCFRLNQQEKCDCNPNFV